MPESSSSNQTQPSSSSSSENLQAGVDPRNLETILAQQQEKAWREQNPGASAAKEEL